MEWRMGPGAPRMGPAEVHVWRAALDLDASALGRAWRLLTADERRRAERMRFPAPRARFVAARAALRILLGRYLDRAPLAVPLVIEPGGRPAVEAGAGGALRFSVSHAGRFALYAFARERDVGIDLERVRTRAPFERLATRFFTAAEADALRAFPSEVLPAAFFACWTRKEALFKARGGTGGLVPDLKRFAVSVAPREPVVALRFLHDDAESARWTLSTLHPAPGYAAALAVAGPAAATCFAFDWSD